MLRRIRSRRRKGSALTEGVLVIIPFTIMVLAVIELGVAVMRSNSLSAAARYGARQAAVHGEFASQRDLPRWSGPWSPVGGYPGANPYTVTADQNDPIANAIRPYLVGFRGQDVTITVEWIDPVTHARANSNRAGNQVWVRVQAAHHNRVTNILGLPLINMGSASTMIIEH